MQIWYAFVMLFVMSSSVSYAESFYACQDVDGHITYTNSQQKGMDCHRLTLPDVSTSPTRSYLPAVPSQEPMGLDAQQEIDPPLVEGPRETFTIHPDIGGNVAAQVCDLYGKWLDLNLATRGGLYWDPRTAPLLSIFAGGFIPMECRK